MAYVNQGFTFFYSLVDQGGNTSTLRFDALSPDYTQALLDVEIVRNALAALSRASIRSYGITDTFVDDAFSFPTGNVENEDKASITANIAGLSKRANIRIPAPVDAMFTTPNGPGFNVVNGSYAPLLTFLDLFTVSGGVLTLSDGEQLDDSTPYQSGKRVSVKSLRG